MSERVVLMLSRVGDVTVNLDVELLRLVLEANAVARRAERGAMS